MTHETITDPKTLLGDLKAIRTGGIAYAREEQYEGLIAMAAPVFDLYGSVVASIVVTLPTIRFHAKSEKLIKETLCRASERLSRELGFNATSKGKE